MACCISDAVSVGMHVSLDAFIMNGILGEGCRLPPLKVDNNSAVEFLRAVLDSAVGKRSKAVAVQVGQLFLSANDARAKNAFAPDTGLQAVYLYTLLASTQRVRAPSTYALKRLANSFTRKGKGKMSMDKRGSGLLETFCVSIDQRRYDANL
eukprot:6202229-Pleurochrysis_carterae.AAC.1